MYVYISIYRFLCLCLCVFFFFFYDATMKTGKNRKNLFLVSEKNYSYQACKFAHIAQAGFSWHYPALVFFFSLLLLFE